MSALLQRGTAPGELSSSTLRDRASSHAGYATRVFGSSRTPETVGLAGEHRSPPAHPVLVRSERPTPQLGDVRLRAKAGVRCWCAARPPR
jgi:hypothetical protein